MSGLYSDVPIRRAEAPSKNMLLHVRGIRRRRLSFSLNVFLNKPEADHTTSTEDPAYAGTLFMYGQGPSEDPGDPIPEDAMRTRSAGHDALLNITRAVERLGQGAASISVKLVALDEDGKPLPDDVLEASEVFIAVSD